MITKVIDKILEYKTPKTGYFLFYNGSHALKWYHKILIHLKRITYGWQKK